MSGKQYENIDTQVECEDTLYQYEHMFFCQEPTKEVPDMVAVIMA